MTNSSQSMFTLLQKEQIFVAGLIMLMLIILLGIIVLIWYLFKRKTEENLNRSSRISGPSHNIRHDRRDRRKRPSGEELIKEESERSPNTSIHMVPPWKPINSRETDYNSWGSQNNIDSPRSTDRRSNSSYYSNLENSDQQKHRNWPYGNPTPTWQPNHIDFHQQSSTTIPHIAIPMDSPLAKKSQFVSNSLPQRNGSFTEGDRPERNSVPGKLAKSSLINSCDSLTSVKKLPNFFETDEVSLQTDEESKVPPREKRLIGENETIVLLLGESGVGKSTFINALVNYLNFQSLDAAINSKPLVVIPVSFILAVGHDFEEKTIVFGNQDTNENHDNVGASVTQECRSYLFSLNGKTIRIIDTPGMGDTRGIEQDQKNLNNIISYVGGLSHVNGVCILFKPDKARLDIVTRLYFDQLVRFLGPNVNQNIMFCFTNTRSTFYSPGNTGPLVRQMIQKLIPPHNQIQFSRENVLCFDSEALRFLIALQNQIEFSDDEKQEYQQSWTKSVTEAERFLGIVSTCKNLENKFWNSTEHDIFMLDRLARPLLESIRQLLRNLVMIHRKNRNQTISFQSKSLPAPKTICYRCHFSSAMVGSFLIAKFTIESMSDKVTLCQCDSSQMLTIDYQLKYFVKKAEKSIDRSSIQKQIHQLKQIILDIETVQMSMSENLDRPDLFESLLKRMINEENHFASSAESNSWNGEIHRQLVFLNDILNKKKNSHQDGKQSSIDLSSIRKIIERAESIEIVRKQMESLEETYLNMIQSSEVYVSK